MSKSRASTWDDCLEPYANPFVTGGSSASADEKDWLGERGGELEPEVEVLKFKGGSKFNFMNCDSCQSLSPSPVYFCTKGHVYCYRCAAISGDHCGGYPLEKIRPRKILAYEKDYSLQKAVYCDNYRLGCRRSFPVKQYVNHVQFHCLYRSYMHCRINKCQGANRVYWANIDSHMETSHGSRILNLNATCSGQSIKVPYGMLQEGTILTPLVLDYENKRKFIPAIKKDSNRIYFWIYMIDDGLNHDDHSSKFQATLKIGSPAAKAIIFEGDLKATDSLGDFGPQGIDVEVADFEKNYLCRDTLHSASFFAVDIGIEEKKSVMQVKPEPEPEEEDSKGYGELIKGAETEEDLEAVIKNISLCDIIFPRHLAVYETPEEISFDEDKLLANRVESESKKIKEEYQRYLEQPKTDIDADVYHKAFPDNTLTVEEKKERMLVGSQRLAAVKRGELKSTDIPRLEKNFKWTAADEAVLQRFGREGFNRLPTVQSGIYLRKFLQLKMELYFSTQQETSISSFKRRGSFFP